jgi:hypothetical protein
VRSPQRQRQDQVGPRVRANTPTSSLNQAIWGRSVDPYAALDASLTERRPGDASATDVEYWPAVAKNGSGRDDDRDKSSDKPNK